MMLKKQHLHEILPQRLLVSMPSSHKIQPLKCPYSMNETKMTLTERNQKLYELRKKLDQKRMELAWIETEIMAVNNQYDRENIDLFEEMFGEKNTLWDHLDRVTVNN